MNGALAGSADAELESGLAVGPEAGSRTLARLVANVYAVEIEGKVVF